MKKIISMVLAVIMLCAVLPVSAFAGTVDTALNDVGFTVIDNDQSTLAPGVTMNELVLHNSSNQRVEMYVTTVDTTLDTVQVLANYMDNQNAVYGMQTLSAQVAALEAKRPEPFKVVAGVNAAYYNITNGKPLGVFVMEGKDVTGSDGNNYAFFAVLKDGTYMIGAKGEYSQYKGQIQEAVQGHIHLVKDGAVVNGLDKTTLYPRQTLGLTADGKLILMTADGSQAPKTVGLTVQEQAEIMLSLGCVEAIHLDGGNSTTFGAVREGEDKFTLINTPAGGGERTVSNTLVIVSTAMPSGIFDHALIEGDYDYFVPHSTYTFSAIGTDATNAPAEIPEDVSWKLSDESFGTIAKGAFVSNGTLGDVDVQMVYNGAVVGSKTIHIVDPTEVSFALDKTTVPYGRAATLEYQVKYGYNDVYCTDAAFDCSVNPAAAGTVDGFTITAGNDTAITSAVFTAAYKYNDAVAPITIDLAFGKGSDILFDFEDGDISDWHAKETIGAWYEEINQDRNTPLTNPCTEGSNPAAEDSYVFLASTENGGHVRNGQYALGVRLNHSQAGELGAWIYDYLFYTGEEKVLRDVANGVNGIRLGMWIYNPGVTNISIEMYPYCDGGKTMNNSYAYIQGQTVQAKYSTNYLVPESGWMYVYVNLSNKADTVVQTFGSNHNANATYHSRFPAMGRFITGGAIDDPHDLILYIDDITLDYSNATDDRDAPVISNPAVSTDGSNDIALNGQTVATNVLSFKADVAEVSANNMTGLDYTTGKIYIDGVDMSGNDGFSASNGILSLNNVSLSDGTHSVAFVIFDKQGNETRLTKTLTVDTSSPAGKVYLVGRNEGNLTPMAGSVYYIDVKAADASKITEIVTTLKLNTAHRFEYENIVCAKGVSVEADYAALDHELTLKITHDGTLTGDAVLASIPVRVWAYTKTSGSLPVLNIECKTLYGEVTYADAAFDGYAGGFYTALNVATEFIGANTSWAKTHKHNAAAIADKAATCTEDGYTGRTYCEGCASVVSWGTVIPATGHSYEVVGKQLVCHCGEVNNGKGLQNVNGVNYYLLGGELITGWFGIGEDWYYFNPNTYAGVDGEYTVDGLTFVFDNGRVTKGIWVQHVNGLRYWYGPSFYRDTSISGISCRPYVIDGKTYLFSEAGYMQTGIVCHLARLFGDKGEFVYYDCGDDGVATKLTGVYKDRLYVDGLQQNAYQLLFVNGAYYFVNDGHKIAKNITLYLSERFVSGMTFPDGRPIQVGKYEFDAEGKMIIPDVKHGVVGDYLYINDVKQVRYQLVEFDGNFYFVDSGDKIVRSNTLYLSEQYVAGKTFADGRPIQVGKYEFDAEGKMIIPELKHGIVGDYLYINDVKQVRYQLAEFEGNFYFIDSGDKIVKNMTLYLSERFVAGKTFADGRPIQVGKYEFDAEGKMIIPELKHGIVGDYLYINDVKQVRYQLVEFEGNFYFVDSGDKIVKNMTLYLSERFVAGKTFADGRPIQVGKYEFDAEGKMIIPELKHGVVDGYLYINDVKQVRYQLVEFEGDFYFIDSGDKIVKNKTLRLADQYVEGFVLENGEALEPGLYYFDAEGKMVID